MFGGHSKGESSEELEHTIRTYRLMHTLLSDGFNRGDRYLIMACDALDLVKVNVFSIRCS